MVVFEINNKKIEFIKQDNDNGTIYNLPKLTDINKNGKMFWEIFVLNQIFRNYQEGGKIREFPEIVCTGKNIGRANETSDEEQAMLEAFLYGQKNNPLDICQCYKHGSINRSINRSTNRSINRI